MDYNNGIITTDNTQQQDTQPTKKAKPKKQKVNDNWYDYMTTHISKLRDDTKYDDIIKTVKDSFHDADDIFIMLFIKYKMSPDDIKKFGKYLADNGDTFIQAWRNAAD